MSKIFKLILNENLTLVFISLIFSDILKLRETLSENFRMFFAQENIVLLKTYQIEENRQMDEIENFVEVCAFEVQHHQQFKYAFFRNAPIHSLVGRMKRTIQSLKKTIDCEIFNRAIKN